MFQHFKNVDAAFRHIRLFSYLFLAVNGIGSALAQYWAVRVIREERSKVYVLANGKLLEATGTDKRRVLEIRVKDHVRDFHHFFFTASPDEEAIRRGVTRALYLADATAKKEYDNLQESGYYTGIVSGNINQFVEADSVAVDVNENPVRFAFYGKLKIVRATSTIVRSLITTGTITETAAISENNPQGMLIGAWRIISNQDMHR
ncbi:conjugative transposon protein TraK [Chitinophaga cymbidii]|uniref:Conjugative transposon protein TraK n=1 Tax=Chitinophaga cymbidii TaxID=1096750 RepID=A0A512RSA4_9BACT|nr:conjugative transposon protein TraK [Chitinophaga cymbidii]GEP98564.1 conjugative transposon protein TraK [Chitinophaga cymbidii]